jgi:hypothetical protein
MLCALAPLLALAGQAEPATPSRVVFHWSPAIDLYFHVRVADSALAAEPFAPAAKLARELDRALGGMALAWGPLDGLLPGCRTVADLAAAFARAPETLTLRGGTQVELRARALELATALVPAEAAFAELWKERAPRLAAVRTLWEERVGAKERALLDFHLASLGMSDPHLALPVYLVGEAPWPGALTVFDERRQGVSFVAANAGDGSTLLEIVLHEVTHSLDVACGEHSALGELRARLPAPEGALRRGDPAHVLMFVQSAESIRRVIDPAHHDYGDLEGVYARLGAGVAALRGAWGDHLAGRLTRAEAFDLYAESLAPATR